MNMNFSNLNHYINNNTNQKNVNNNDIIFEEKDMLLTFTFKIKMSKYI